MLKAIVNKPILWMLTFVIIFLVTLSSLFSRRRMSHENGLTATGRIRILDELEIPPNEFFQPGREFECRLRHATVSFDDDCRLAARSASLKFTDADHAAPLDLKMNTGTAGPFSSARDFFGFMVATIRGRETHIKPYLDKNPLLVEGIRGAVCYPETFTQLNYHSKTPLEYTDTDGKNWYVKFKLQPWDRGPDVGRPSEEELEEFWLQKIRPGETRSKNYLKDEFAARLDAEPVRYHLQAQFCPVYEDETRDHVLNCAIPWDEERFPWLDLAEVEVDKLMPREAGNLTWYDLRNHPRSMSMPKARSIWDPASVNYLRMHDIWAKRARMLGYKWRGQLPLDPDNRDPLSAARSAICLPQNEPVATRELRNAELITQRFKYEFVSGAGQPAYVKNLPEKESFSTAKAWKMTKDLIGSVVNDLISRFQELFNRRKDLAVFDGHYPLWQEPLVHTRFASDIEFGRQRLNGVNPVLIERCERIPDKLAVTEDMVHRVLDNGDTLESLAGSGRLYILDHAALDGIKARNGYLAVPISLFYTNECNQLLPLAIQLEQRHGPKTPVFTPDDPFWLWTVVKAYVQAADAAYHEVCSHLLRTHMAMETFEVGRHRQLHDRHPMFQLLQPHFHDTLAINHAARTKMLAPGGPIDKVISAGAAGSLELLRREYATWNFSLCDLPADLARRGVDDPQLLSNYFYRDDGLAVWGAIQTYVSGVVDFWYPTAETVVGDHELQAWVAELSAPDAGNVVGLLPAGTLDNAEDLKRIMTCLIFTCTAEHSSVNNGQYDMFGYPPNVPGSMYKPWPTSKDDPLTEADFVACLPNHAKTYAQMQMVHLLSAPTRWMIGNFEEPYFHGIPEIWNLARDFRRDLSAISESIARRNEGLEVPYTYLDPRQISESIAV